MTDSATEAHIKGERIIQELSRQNEQLSRVIHAIQSQGQRRDFRRVPGQLAADANGNAYLGFQVPIGVGWNLVSVAATGGPDTGNSGCAIYLNSVEPMNLVAVLDYGQRMSMDFQAEEYVAPGQYLIVAFTGQTNGNLCTANIKIENMAA